jgi:membrane associated rhomboid family serine protease
MAAQIKSISLNERLRTPAVILGGFIILIWLLEILDVVFFEQALNRMGLRPRSLIGLTGIVTMPFLHNGLGHVAANTLPFVVLGGIIMLRNRRDFFAVTAIVALVTGLGLWLLGDGNAVYIGASGLVFGYFGFIFVRAYFDRNVVSLALGIVVLLLYGGFLWGLLPRYQPGVSWGAHFLGFIGGVVAAWLIARNGRQDEDTGRAEGDVLEQIQILD